MTQVFKGDAIEEKMISSGSRPLESCSAALSEYFEGCYDVEDFLLAQYDAGRMPFSERVPRASFVTFFKQLIPNAPFTGSYESYLFLVESIFGEHSTVTFDHAAVPGKLQMAMDVSTSGLEFECRARVFVDGAYDSFTLTTNDDEILILRGLAGIDSQAELEQLLSELIPVGIYTEITLTFFSLYAFADDEPGDTYTVVDDDGDGIVFYEPEG